MTKPVSELIALAGELSFAAENTQGCLYGQRKMLHAAAGHIRTAANQSSSERAGVDALREALTEWLEYAELNFSEFDLEECFADDGAELCPKCRSNGCLNQKIARTRKALATPPAQPAQAGGSYDVRLHENILDQLQNSGVEACGDCSQASQHHSGDLQPSTSEAPSTHGAVREITWWLNEIEACNERMRNGSKGTYFGQIAKGVEIIRAALHSPKIAVPGDVLAMKEACKRVALTERNDCLSAVASIMRHRTDSEVQAGNERFYRGGAAAAECIAAAIDRLDVKAEAKSQEPDAVAYRWRGVHSNGPYSYSEIPPMPHSDYPTEPLYTHPTTKPEAPAVSVDAIKHFEDRIQKYVTQLNATGQADVAHLLQRDASALVSAIAGER